MNKKTLLLLVSSSFALSLLPSCSQESQMYKIDFYTDYEGIHSGEAGGDYAPSELKKENAIYVGSGYVSKKSSSRVARLSHVEVGEDGKAVDYHSTRQRKEEGRVYTFDGWQGFYPEGSDPLSGSKVDLNDIRADCSVFAHFSVSLETYFVSVGNVDSAPVFESVLSYGTRLGDALASKFGDEATARSALSGLAYPFSLPYYEIRPFSGDYLDASGNAYDLDSLFDWTVKRKESFKPNFNEAVYRTYTVSLFRDSSLQDPLEIDGKSTFELPYGDAFASSAPAYEDGGFVYSFAGWEGVYSGDAPSSISGKKVDSSHILFDCSLYPTYKRNHKTVNVTFLNADGSEIKTSKADCGSEFGDLDLPSEVGGVSSGLIFSSFWSTTGTDGTPDSWMSEGDLLEKDLTLHPVLTQKEFRDVLGAKGDSLSYEYDTSKKGYVLTSFSPSSSRTDKVLVEEDLALSSLPSSFSLVGIKKFGDSSDDSYRTAIESASFPTSVAFIGSNAFAYNTRLSSLSLPGLQEADSFAFASLFSLPEITLPSSLQRIGSRAFYGDSSLNTIHLSMTEKEAETKGFASDWNSNGTGLISVSYLSE